MGWPAEIRAYGSALWNHWKVLLTGVSALVIGTALAARGVTPWAILAVIAAITFVVAQFLAWRDAHRALVARPAATEALLGVISRGRARAGELLAEMPADPRRTTGSDLSEARNNAVQWASGVYRELQTCAPKLAQVFGDPAAALPDHTAPLGDTQGFVADSLAKLDRIRDGLGPVRS